MIEVRHDNANKVSKCTILLLLVVIATTMFINMIERSKIVYNFVDLQMKYKNYIIIDKDNYVHDNEEYIFILQNPITLEKQKIYVKPYLYHNVYFVGDTIK